MNDAVYQWFTRQPSLYWLVALPFAVLLLVAALQPRRIPRWMFLGGLAICLLAFRWPVVVVGAENNSDESQLIAAANTLLHRPVFWRDVDAHAIGPLAIYPLTLLGAIGIPLDYEAARLFGLLVEWAGLVAGYRLLREITGEAWARIGILPLVAFHALTRQVDFLQYSSETIAGALLAAGFALLWVGARGGSAGRQAAGALVLGLSAWAKLQALPIAVALVAGVLSGALLTRFRKDAGDARQVMAPVAGFLAALVLPLAAIGAAGLWSDWSDAYVRAGLGYLGSAQAGFWPAAWWFVTDLESGFPVYALPLMAILVGLGAMARRRDPSMGSLLVVTGLASLAAGVAIAGSGRLFPHYLGLALLLPLPPAAACVAVLFPAGESGRPRTEIVAFWLACTLLPQAAFVASPRTLSYDFPPGINHLDLNGAARVIREQARPGDTMTVWGWEPRVYVMTGLPQGSREAHTERLIEEGPMRDFYRSRFLTDFRKSPPVFFVDGIVPDNFAFNDRRRHGFELWPDLARLIAVDYYLLESIEGYRIYRRIDRKG